MNKIFKIYSDPDVGSAILDKKSPLVFKKLKQKLNNASPSVE